MLLNTVMFVCANKVQMQSKEANYCKCRLVWKCGQYG